MNKCVLPFSGGLDSTTILHHVLSIHSTVYTVFIDYGQKHLLKEYDAYSQAVKRLVFQDENIVSKVLDLSFFKEISNISALTNSSIAVPQTKDVLGDPQAKSYVPFRNMMIMSICSAYAESVGADFVYHGATQVDTVAGFWDSSPEFITAINNVNILNRRRKIQIVAPLIDKSKADIIKWGTTLAIDYSKTWTCYEGKDLACGTCQSCSSRLKGFIDAGIKDPINYSVEIPWDKLLLSHST